jgi:hypothetical protein
LISSEISICGRGRKRKSGAHEIVQSEKEKSLQGGSEKR